MRTKEQVQSNRDKAYQLRCGGFTYRQISEALNICTSHSAVLVKEADKRIKNSKEWWSGLSVRALNALYNMDIKSKDDLLNAFAEGRINPRRLPRNAGLKTYFELAAWLDKNT